MEKVLLMATWLFLYKLYHIIGLLQEHIDKTQISTISMP